MIANKSSVVHGLIRAVGIVICALVLMAQTVASRAADEAGVRQAGKDYLAAAERGDAKALADLWTADGTYTDENGRTTKAHDLLAKSSSSHLARPSATLDHTAVRFVTDDVAVEDADCQTAAASGRPPIEGHYTALWVRQDGRWKLANLRETRIAPNSSSADDLASLQAFAGEWSGQINDATIHISAKWDAGKKFLRRDFSVTSGKSPLVGTQEIGFDPATGRIRSWAFMDDGSYGEGLWSLQGTVWMEVSSRTLSDGKTVKAIQVYKFPDKNTLNWKLIRGSIDGKPVQTMEVVLKRS